jgi:SAM-dependent methyltransferase
MPKRILNRLLEVPYLYSFVQHIAAPGQKKLLGVRFARIFGSSKGLVLDVGCGPKLTTPLPEGTLVGVDINADYIREYTGGRLDTDWHAIHDKKKPVYGFVSPADKLSFEDNLFDECRCAGLLHHLPAESARTAIREMHRCVRRGGKIVIFDNVMPRSGFLRFPAWLIRKIDRGKWVRNEDQLSSLIGSASEETWQRLRFTYSYYGLEGMIFVAVKR